MERGLILDVHSHILTKSYIDFMSKRGYLKPSGLTVWGRNYPVNKFLLDLDEKLKDLKSLGGEVIPFLSIPPPWTYFLPKEEEVRLVKEVNDELAKMASDRIRTLATLPMTDVNEAMGEAERAIKDLGMDGFIVGTGLNVETIADDRFEPLLRKLANLGKPVFLHPGTLILGLDEGAMSSTVSYPFETTFVLAKLGIRGILREFNLKLIVPHGGGYLPYQLGRFDMLYETGRSKFKLSEELNNVFFDVVVYHKMELELLYRRFGVDKMLYGTDHPFPISRPALFARIVEETLPKEKEKVFYQNAKKLFELNWL
ncbi:amidohydrolase [Metallosphaera tengchongensis]|uniref:Amidohydrolase n=1 Tax=Metallosphaera tengchongensis TaxID=1532350 RepID=A0A6N0NU82_9CREN|nr:amidohydrolase family protein [Metallosphaera tengchongensis]QKQ99027.1 amidohydrolase [Metallosphaera tengchongensis]